jgi:hypothetical protein
VSAPPTTSPAIARRSRPPVRGTPRSPPGTARLSPRSRPPTACSPPSTVAPPRPPT